MAAIRSAPPGRRDEEILNRDKVRNLKIVWKLKPAKCTRSFRRSRRRYSLYVWLLEH
jgi:hypothetical protein